MIKNKFYTKFLLLSIVSMMSFLGCIKNDFNIIYITPPRVDILTPSNIEGNSAKGNIEITNQDTLHITLAGICFSSTNFTPTYEDDNVVLSQSGKLSGNYSLNLSNLDQNTVYFLRGFIIYENDIIYSNTTITITTISNLPKVIKDNITEIKATKATINFNVLNPNNVILSSAGVCYSDLTNLPTITNNIVPITNGILLGNYSAQITGLLFSTKYYVRSYISYNNIVYYSEADSFITSDTLSNISLDSLTNISRTNAIGNFKINNSSNMRFDAAGICYSSTSINPVLTDNFSSIAGGNLNGNYTANLTNLTPFTTYYVRAYYNYNGSIYYSNALMFITPNLIPTVSITNVSTISDTAAKGNFNINNSNNIYLKAAGICFSNTNTTPEIQDGYVDVFGGELNGNYVANVTCLKPNTTYFIRAYINFNGTIYYSTNVLNFQTNP